MLEQPTKLTDDYRKTSLARSVPDSYFADNAWWLPPDPDPESARKAIKLFPALMLSEPELVVRARLSSVDHTPIDFAMPAWKDRPRAADPWRRVDERCAALDIEPHLFQRVYAQYAIDGLNAGKGGYLGHEMGLGKTLEACMVIDGWDANFIFIACPNNAKQDPWVQHLERFCPWIKPVVVGNTAAARKSALDEAHARLEAGEPTALICHYQAIPIIEGANKRGWLRFGQWDLLISDEAHLYKNRKAKFTSACRRLKAVGRLDLSGSVMSGAAEDLFVPYQMHMPKRYRSQWRDWNDRFLEVVKDDYGQNQIIGPLPHRLPEFRAELGEILTVARARDWLPGVPEPHIVQRELAMHPEQLAAYHKMADELMAEMPDGTINYTTDGAPLRSALRQITAGVPQDEGLLSSKHDAAMEDILAAGDSQCVYFTWHKRPAYELQRRCLAAKVPCAVICGDVPTRERERRIELFKGGGYRVIVATIKTLSSAANLQNASVVGMLEESDDPVDNEQAIGRVVRQGQTVNASVYYYRIKDSVDDLSVQTNYIAKAELRKLILGML